MVRLDRNQRQSRTEKRMLRRNTTCPGGNVQQREGYGGELYGGRGGQITWRAGAQYMSMGNRRGNSSNRGGNQLGPWKDPNAMDVDRGRGEDRTCYHCGKFDHMA